MMTTERPKAIKVFYCYSHTDKMLRDELEMHLGTLKRLGQITGWYDREIEAGTEWEQEIERQLDTAGIILLLISANFIHSDYCYSTEMQRALDLHKAGRARVIPIILRPVDWQGTPIAQLQVLPSEGKPVISSSWHSQDEAFYDVARGIRAVIETLSPQPLRPTGLSETSQAGRLWASPKMLVESREDSYILSRIWSKLSTDLREVLLLAFNTSQQEVSNKFIDTRHVLAALQNSPNTAEPLLARLPQEALPRLKASTRELKEHDLMEIEPPVSSCVEESLRERVENLDEGEKVTALDFLIELLRTGNGSSVSRLRRAGITPNRVDELVRSLDSEEERKTY